MNRTLKTSIVVMKNGEIQQVGTPQDIYNEPANRFVAQFIGESNSCNRHTLLLPAGQQSRILILIPLQADEL